MKVLRLQNQLVIGLLFMKGCCLLGIVISVSERSKGQHRCTLLSQYNPCGQSPIGEHFISDEKPAAHVGFGVENAKNFRENIYTRGYEY